jgi:hypothetical protein
MYNCSSEVQHTNGTNLRKIVFDACTDQTCSTCTTTAVKYSTQLHKEVDHHEENKLINK